MPNNFAYLDSLLDQTASALESGNYLPALLSLLTVADVCGALQSTDGQSKGDRYKKWMQDFVGYSADDAERLWRYRCSALHQGSGIPDRAPDTTWVMFIPPNNQLSMHRTLVPKTTPWPEGYLWVIDVGDLLDELRSSVLTWKGTVGQTEIVSRNLRRSLNLWSNGFFPMIQGLPVVG